MLIAATVAEIHARGSLGVTMQGIAARAGVSGPLASHYFGSKDALILAALRDMLERLRQDVVAALRASDTPRARLSAIVAANFGPQQFQAHTIAAWLNFYVRALGEPEARRLLRVYLRRLNSNLLHAASALLPRDEAEALAETVSALIDGFYLRHALRRRPPDAAHVKARIETVIRLALGEPRI